MAAPFPIKPYVDSAPVLDVPPVATDWGMLVRIIGGIPGPSTVDLETFGTATMSQVPASLVSVVLLAANTNRKAAIFFNETPSRFLYLAYGAVSSTAAFVVRLGPRSYHEIPSPGLYNGVVSGIWTAGAGGFCAVTEVTPP